MADQKRPLEGHLLRQRIEERLTDLDDVRRALGGGNSFILARHRPDLAQYEATLLLALATMNAKGF